MKFLVHLQCYLTILNPSWSVSSNLLIQTNSDKYFINYCDEHHTHTQIISF